MSTNDIVINNLNEIDLNNLQINKNDESPDIRSLSKKKRHGADEFSFQSNEETFYKDFISRLEILKKISIETSAYYEQKFFTINVPTILLTTIGGMTGFLSSSEYFNDTQRIFLGVCVGVIGGCSSLLQAIQTAFKFGTKAELFRGAAEQYERLIVEMKFELLRHNDKDFADKLEKKILEIQSNCKYFAPRHIVDKYNKNCIKLKSITIEN